MKNTSNIKKTSISLTRIPFNKSILVLLFTIVFTSFTPAQKTANPVPVFEGFDEATYERDFQHYFTEVNDITLHYVMGGDGPALVLLHGWPFTSYSFRQIMPELAKHFTVIAVDLRGFGDSDKPDSANMTKPQMADDIVDLMQQLGHQKIAILGHDWGGVVAYEIAWNNPELVERMIFFEMILPGFGMDDPKVQAGFWQFGFHRAPDIAETLVEGKEREYVEFLLRGQNIYNRRAFTREDIDEFMRTYGEPGGFRTTFQLYRDADEDGERFKRYAAERKLDIPVLALGGITSMRNLTERDMHEIATNVEGIVIPQFGHAIEENPQGVIDATLPFLLKGKE